MLVWVQTYRGLLVSVHSRGDTRVGVITEILIGVPTWSFSWWADNSNGWGNVFTSRISC